MILDLLLWQSSLIFAVSAAAVVGAGVVLARYGDAIATGSGLGGLFIGMLLLATATSLPEIVTAASAAAVGSPDLAIGDLLGSSMANMAILAFTDLLYRRRVWPTIGPACVAASPIRCSSSSPTPRCSSSAGPGAASHWPERPARSRRRPPCLAAGLHPPGAVVPSARHA